MHGPRDNCPGLWITPGPRQSCDPETPQHATTRLCRDVGTSPPEAVPLSPNGVPLPVGQGFTPGMAGHPSNPRLCRVVPTPRVAWCPSHTQYMRLSPGCWQHPRAWHGTPDARCYAPGVPPPRVAWFPLHTGYHTPAAGASPLSRHAQRCCLWYWTPSPKEKNKKDVWANPAGFECPQARPNP